MSDLPTVYLARHGETAWSQSGQHTSYTDLPLLPAGEDAARKLRERLAGLQFRHVFSSPLRRAQRTAELAGFTPELDDDLREWNYGDYEGITSAEIARQRPGWDLFRDGTPNGETPQQIADRADRLVAKWKNLHGNILCFAHGHILRVIAARWINFPVQLGAALLLDTASVSILSFNHNNRHEPAIKVWNS